MQRLWPRQRNSSHTAMGLHRYVIRHALSLCLRRFTPIIICFAYPYIRRLADQARLVRQDVNSPQIQIGNSWQ
ncbi:hypothetical protein MGWOODY_Hyp2202 [hydrothermal vent metagenome]|uniref:Uncharacterized protein n=1 Tax=hydrothermal vent metagenome TaxID=652676 RepID=A0A160U067_9ZZZZ